MAARGQVKFSMTRQAKANKNQAKSKAKQARQNKQ
jgi:hypothetical protein